MADILRSQTTVPALSTQTESAVNLALDHSKKIPSSYTNKYNGHVTRLRNVFISDQSVTMEKQSKSKSSSMINPLIREDISSSSSSHHRYSPSEQHYDFPADALQQLKKHQRDENEGHVVRPSLLPTNVFKRMNHLNTTFVKPTKIEGILPKFVFEETKKKITERSESLESPEINDNDADSLIYYEIAGIPTLDDEDNENDDSLNDVRRVRFSHAPIRVYPTYSPKEYDRRNEDIDPFSASAEYELEKRIEKMDVFTVEIEKGTDGLGISILGMGVGADSGLEKLGIFVKTLNSNGVIGRDGRIQVGDQIIEVNDYSLVGVTHLYATNVLKNTSGVVKFVIGREKDLNKSEILGLIQRSLQLDREREEMSKNFQQYHDAYYEQNFNDDDSENINEQKIPNQFEIEILKQCYESLEKTLECTEKDKEHYQQLYEQLLNDFKEIEGKYVEAKLLIKQYQDRETELNEQHEKQVQELMKRIEELEKTTIIISKNSLRLPSLSMDKMSMYSQQESWPMNSNLLPINSVSTTNKSLEQLDENLSPTFIKIPTKHFSTPSLGEISNDSEVFSNTIPIVPSLAFDSNEPVEIKDWTIDQCIQWLTAQQMTSLISLFITRNINGEKLLVLDSAKMKAMGIKSSRDREQLKMKIKELKHAELNRARERLLNQSSSLSIPSISKRLRSSSLTRLKERRFFTSINSGK